MNIIFVFHIIVLYLDSIAFHHIYFEMSSEISKSLSTLFYHKFTILKQLITNNFQYKEEARQFFKHSY